MTETPAKNVEQSVLIRNCLISAAAWTIICVLASTWNVMEIMDKSLGLAEKEARTIIDKDQALRYWATDHNGVYVPVTEETPPNPYLSHLPERDIVTPSGRQLTLLDPASFLRQVSERFSTLYKGQGHITSLKLINPQNAPDDWEKAMLREFEAGKQEARIFTKIDGEEYFRLMIPLPANQGCLQCHAQQGFKEGDVRGGLSVTVPLAPYRNMERQSLRHLQYTHLFFWAAGLLIICLSFYRSLKRLIFRQDSENLLREQSEKIELFAYSVAHDLKNPVIAIHGLARILNKRHLEGMTEKGRQYIVQIEESARQVSALVDQINAFISSKEQPIYKETLNLLDICHTVRAESSQRLNARNIAWFEPEEPVIFEADKMVILRILRNLVDNALKYGGPGLSKITISHGESTHFHTIMVANDGKAISKEDCRNIFLKFKRNCIDHKVEGTGLGLAIVKELVSLHGGRIWASSDGKQGVSFAFSIAKKTDDEAGRKSRFAPRQSP
ncbi:MAG: DUF3365 domain-containing protein [Desulforhopalus sp.]|nr:DUF3365 domain-containing protein [Desulforhopalus sp.]